MVAFTQTVLLATAGLYLALLPTNAATFIRSVLFGVASVLALSLILAGWTGRGERIPSPGNAIVITLFVWCAWDFASLLWTVHYAYSAGELRREIAWNLLVMTSFYVAARDTRSWQKLVATALASFALLAALAVGLATSIGGWDAGHWHVGVGAFSTYLVMVAPLLIMLLAPPPGGFGGRSSAMLLALVLLALILAAARLSDNRMVWVALATVFVTAFGLAAIRWRAVLKRMPMRWYAPVLMLMMITLGLFAETVLDKAKAHFPPQTTIAQTFASDPRLELWNRTVEVISLRPWTGYGFGKSILQQELRSDLNDPTMTHAHNLFVSQWLQTGAIGFGAFVALLLALFWRYVRFFRSPDDTRALLGLIGIALLAGFVVKNVTDDFLLRSNAREFWALNAALIGLGMRRERAGATGTAP